MQTVLGKALMASVLFAVLLTFIAPMTAHAIFRESDQEGGGGDWGGGGGGGGGGTTAECADGVDNDGNGVTDYPSDLGCTSYSDTTESGYTVATQCADGVDNDRNGLIDTNDPGCSSGSDSSESGYTTQCSDGSDNDGNGYRDIGDPGCSSLSDTSESGYVRPPAPPPGVEVYKTQSKRDYYVKVQPDQLANGGLDETSAHGYPTYSTGQASPTGNRICYLYDPTAFITEWSLGGFSSPGNNSMAAWNPSTGKWYRGSAGSFGNLRYNYLTCKTNATPDTSLTATANGTTGSSLSVTSGTPVTLTWLSQWGQTRKGSFTAQNYSLTTTTAGYWQTVTNYICGYDGGGGGGDSDFFYDYVASGPQNTLTAQAGGSCWETSTVWVAGSTTYRPYGGTTVVTPTQTTTYTYTGTNANGSSSASVTVTVTGEGTLSSSTCSVDPIVAGTGDSVTWTAAPVGGTGTYSYVWSGTDSLSGTTQSVVKSYSSEGAKTGSVQITSGTEVANISCTTSLTISNAPACNNGVDDDGAGGADYPADPSCNSLTDDSEDGNVVGASVSCTVDSAVVTAGTQTTYRVTPAGGATAPYTWTPSSQTGCTGGANNTCTFTNPGPYTMSVQASNSAPVSCPVVTVGCVGTPEVSLTANGEAEDTRVNVGEAATIAWEAEGISATSCTLYENEVAIQTLTPNACNVTGSVARTIDTQMVYTLNCDGETSTVIVNIDAGPEEF